MPLFSCSSNSAPLLLRSSVFAVMAKKKKKQPNTNNSPLTMKKPLKKKKKHKRRSNKDKGVKIKKPSQCVPIGKGHPDASKSQMVGEGVIFRMSARDLGSAPCCKCGILMTPNAANMCLKCLLSEVNITEGLQKRVNIMHCPKCDSYLQSPRNWIKANLKSNELLEFCVENLTNMKKVKIESKEFVRTDPHSKRIKVKLRVQKVHKGVVLEKAYVVEYVPVDLLCENCCMVHFDPGQCKAIVQLRQNVSHRKTFFYLELLIRKHGGAAHAINIVQVNHGIDFFFAKSSHGVNFVEFLGKFASIRSCPMKQIVSRDNYKFTFSIEICPLWRDDLIYLPSKVASKLGNLGPFVLCTKVTNRIFVLDPDTLQDAVISATQYWRVPFGPLRSSYQLVEYCVIHVENVNSEATIQGIKYALADVQVVRVCDLGKDDTTFIVRTHLGHLLKWGDRVLGYDLRDIEIDTYNGSIPDIILVKKAPTDRGMKMHKNHRKLKSLNMEVDHSKGLDEEKIDAEYEEFRKELLENPELLFDNLSLNPNEERQPLEMTYITDEGDSLKPLEKLLADLGLSDKDYYEDQQSGGGSIGK